MNCPICSYGILAQPTDGSYDTCLACGCEVAKNMQPRPSSEYAEIEWYGPRWEFDLVAKWLGRASVLEIGCGEGFFARCLPISAEYYGVDFNAKARRVAESYFRECAPNFQFFDDCSEVTHKVDALCMFHVAEHIPEIKKNLSELILRCRPKMIAISVPNQGRFTIRMGLRESWDYPPHHLYRFSVAGMASLLGSLGYSLYRYESEPLRREELLAVLRKYLGVCKLSSALSNAIRIIPYRWRPRLGQASVFLFKTKSI